MEEKVVDKTLLSVKIARFRELGLLGFIIILAVLVQMRNASFLTI